MITRKAAVERLYQLINSGVFEEDVTKDLQDIANCIEDEEFLNIHTWGMDDSEYTFLNTAFRTDLPNYEIMVEKQREIIEKHKFKEVDDEDL